MIFYVKNIEHICKYIKITKNQYNQDRTRDKNLKIIIYVKYTQLRILFTRI